MKEPSPYFIQRSAPTQGNHIDYGAGTDDRFVRVDLWEYWRTIRKHLWLVLAVPLTLAILVGLRDYMATPLYTAQAEILIKTKVPQVFADASVEPSGSGAGTKSAWDVNAKTEYQLLKSRSLASRVIATEGLASNPAFSGVTKHRTAPAHSDPPASQPAPGLINEYLGDLSVNPVSGTELVNVNFTTPNPTLSAELANAHVREFIQQGIELNTQASEEAQAFLHKKLDHLKRQLTESELALNNYRRKKGIIPGLISVNGNEDVVLGRLNKLSAQVEAAHLKTINLGTDVGLIRQGHANELPAVTDSAVIQTLEGELDKLETRYKSMSVEYKPDYPPMAALTAKIKGTRDALRHQINRVVAGVKEQYAAAVKDSETLRKELKQEKDFDLGLNDAAVKYAILRREADTNRQLYDAVLKRIKDVELTSNLHASNVSIVNRATPPLHPSSPRKARDLLAAVLLGLLGGLGLVFVIDRNDDAFRSAEEIEVYLQVPNLAMIPDAHSNGTVYGFPRLSGPKRPQVSPSPKKEVAISYGAYSPVGEAFRMLRASLLLSRAGAPPRTVLITSADPQEGKTTVAANLAISLARARNKVVLVDADLRRPSCDRIFGIDNRVGLTQLLTGALSMDDVVQPTTIDGLSVVTSGKTPPDPGELLASDSMRDVLSELADNHDFVIVDTAPLLPVADTIGVTRVVDGVVLVTNSKSQKQQTKAAISRLRYVQAKIFGVVLNQVSDTFGYQGYRYEYPPLSDFNGIVKEADSDHER